MANKDFVVRQGTIRFTKAALNPATTEFLGVTSDGLVVTTGIPSGNFDNYTLITTTENVSADLQNQIDALSAASSGGIASLNNVTNPGGNIDLITSTSEVSITPDDVNDEISIDVDLSAYATTVITDALSGAIDTNTTNIAINTANIAALSGADYVNTLNGEIGDITIVAGANVGVDTTGTTITISANEGITDHNDLNGLQGGTTNEYFHWTAADYADRILTTEVQAISAGLDGRITVLEGANYVNTINSQTGDITIVGSGGVAVVTDGTTITVSADEATIDHNDLNGLQGGTAGEYYHWTESDYNDRILTTEVAAISSGLDSRLDTIEGETYVNSIEGLTGTVDISGSGGVTISTNGNSIVIDGAAAYTDEDAQDAVGLILTDTNSIDFTYDDGTPQITADVIVNSDSLEIDGSGVRLKDTVTGNRTFANDVTVSGNLYVNGDEFIVNTETVSASDNIIVINGGEVGPGVTSGYSGIRVDRGSAADYFFIFDEERVGFAIGVSTDETSANLSQTQMVATREDSPLDGGFAQWNGSQNTFISVPASTISDSISGDYVNIAGDTMTGTLTVPDLNIGTGGATSTQAVAENNDVDTGTEVIDTFASNLGTGAMWIVTINDGTNYRTSTVTAAWDGTNIEFTETSTCDIGDTSGLDMDAVINGSDVELRATTTSNDWTVKSHRILL